MCMSTHSHTTPRGPGRPPKGDKAMRVVAIRLTDEQLAWLEETSARLGDIGVRPALRVVLDHARARGLAPTLKTAD